MSDSEPVSQQPKKLTKLKRYVWRFSRSGWYQLGFSVLVGLVWTLFHIHHKSQAVSLVLGTFGAYFGFLVGVAAILILISSMTVGLLVYFFQIVKGDQNLFYGRFRDCIADLRDFLDQLHSEGIISRSYDQPFRDIEMLMKPKELPLAFEDPALAFMDIIRDELLDQLESDEESEWVFWRIATRMAIAEDSVRALGINLIQRVVMRVWVAPVLKSFWTLAAVVLALLIGVIHFSGLTAVILNGIAIGVACMTVLLLIEAGRIAVQESQEYFNDETDIAHDETDE